MESLEEGGGGALWVLVLEAPGGEDLVVAYCYWWRRGMWLAGVDGGGSGFG